MKIDTHELTGLGEVLTASAGRLGAKVSAIVRKSAFDIERDAKSRAPVDTGFLKGSITTDFTGDGRFTTMTAEVGPTAEYGIFQELGTSHQAPQPYLAPAFDTHEPSFEAALATLGLEVLK